MNLENVNQLGYFATQLENNQVIPEPHSLVVVVGVAAGQLEQVRVEEGVGSDETLVAQVVGVAVDHQLA